MFVNQFRCFVSLVLRVIYYRSVCEGLQFQDMKMIPSAVLCLLAISGTLAMDACYQDVLQGCIFSSSSVLSLPRCNAIYGQYERHVKVKTEMQAYANLLLERSYQYLLSAAYFNNYGTNRAGFSKLFRKLSDEAWEKTINIIKHVTMRGDVMNFTQRSTREPDEKKNYTVELHELESLGKALDMQKEIAERAFFIHHEATRNREQLHDPEIAQYLEEEFIEYQAKRVRELAGYTTDLQNLANDNGQDLSVSLYLFDEYLQKVV